MSGHYNPHYPFHVDENQTPLVPQQQQLPQQQAYSHQPGLSNQSVHPFHQLPQLQTVGSTEHLRAQIGGYDQSQHGSPTTPHSARQRKRAGTGSEVKHRRTRSGCFTCRNRRVKCDETHPICDRCRKGNRECVYPEPTSATRPRPRPKGQSQESDSSGEEPESAIRESLPPILDEEPLPASAGASESSTATSRRDPSKTPSLTQDKSPSPSTEGSATLAAAASRRATAKSARPEPHRTWSELPQNLRFYLSFHKESLSHHHYGFKYDGTNFLKTTFLEIAVRFEPLLYGVAGFAAYHHTLTKQDGKLQDFLGYYNRSVTLLRASLQQSPRPTIATLLTVLQLATMEEFLGDWVSLLSHQKAAYEILTSLYTPQSIMQNDTLRKILSWYIRFDLFAGLMSGYEPILGREWFNSCHKYYLEQSRQYPQDLQWKYEERLSRYRVLCNDVASIFGRKSRGLIGDDDQFSREVDALQQGLLEWKNGLDSTLRDPRLLAQDFPSNRPRDPDDIVDPFEPGTFYTGELFFTNSVLIDYWAIQVMFKAQLANCQQHPLPAEVTQLAYKVCQTFESIEFYAHSPPGCLLSVQASLGVASMYLPKDRRHSMWVRRKLATVEAMGYIFPATYRARMGGILNADVSHWWLPNEEGLPVMLRSIRELINDRNSGRQHDQVQQDDIREMKGLFSNMSIDQTPSPPTQPTQSPGQQGVRPGRMEKGKGPEDETMTQGDTLVWEDSPEYGWAFQS